jgi:hypothetical protein
MAKKQPRHKQSPQPKKEAKHLKDPEGYQHQLIAWHFQCMDVGGEWPCTCQTINDLMGLLCEYEKMTWGEADLRRHTHPMPTHRICERAQNRLMALRYEDAASLYQFEIAGGQTRRLWGFRQQNILQILWWDPNHTVYPMKR